MIELCFDQSTCGALRQAQHCGAGGRKAFGVIFGRAEADGSGEDVESTTVIGYDDGKKPTKREIRQVLRDFQRKREELAREAIPLGGNAGDVLGLCLGLDMGDIREPFGEARRTFLEGLFPNDRETADLYWRENLESADRLRACGPGDAVRIWADRTPHSACGLLHAASLLKGTNAAVSVVTLSPWRALSDNAVETYLGWGEVAPELFGHFLSREEPLPPAVLGVLTGRWRELQEENAPLRAVINGSVRGVGEDFYDPLLRRHIPEGRTKIAHIIGEVLGREKPGIGDTWFSERIRWMLSTGELRMVEEDREMFYSSTVERA